jgi:hypothetical protein
MGSEQAVRDVAAKLFTVGRGEQVVQNKSFRFPRPGRTLTAFLDRTAEAQRPEKRR